MLARMPGMQSLLRNLGLHAESTKKAALVYVENAVTRSLKRHGWSAPALAASGAVSLRSISNSPVAVNVGGEDVRRKYVFE